MRSAVILGFAILAGAVSGQQVTLLEFDGPAAPPLLGTPDPSTLFGTSVSGLSDVDGDGVRDVLVGASGRNSIFNTVIVPGSASVFSGFDGTLIHFVQGNLPGVGITEDEFGFAVSGVGDVDGDGVEDFAVGAPANRAGNTNVGRVAVFSGAAGTMLFTVLGSNPLLGFGESIAGMGDVNGDGVPDIAIGAPGFLTGGQQTGRLDVVSGTDGTLLWSVPGASPADRFGASVASVADLDNDGVRDVICGAPQSLPSVLSGRVVVLSGANGAVIHTIPGSAMLDRFGASVCEVGDIDGDGVADFAAGAPLDGTAVIGGGGIRVYSGATATLLYAMSGTTAFNSLGGSVVGPGDLDGDGVPEIVAGESAIVFGNPGRVHVFSGQTGGELFTLVGEAPGDQFGASLGAAGDINGDGLADLVIGAPTGDGGGMDSGTAVVVAGHRGLLLRAPRSVPIGSVLVHELEAFPPTPNAVYAFDVSVAGSSPGIPLPAAIGGVFPLNPPLLFATFGPTFPSAFFGYTGNLDAAGTATPAATIPNLPSLVGFVVYGAGLTLDPAGPFGVGRISNGQRTVLAAP